MHYCLYDDFTKVLMRPFTHTRAIADIRCGIFTMGERWERLLGKAAGVRTFDYLQPVYPLEVRSGVVLINASVFATKEIVTAIQGLNEGEALQAGDTVIAHRTNDDFVQTPVRVKYGAEVQALVHAWDIFSLNDAAIRADFALLTEGKSSQPIPEGVTAIGRENIYIAEGAKVQPGVILNASEGPIYLAAGSEVMEGAMIRGPFSLGEGAVVKMGAKIYGGTTIGPGCKVGGELSNVVFFANSNKGHDGYLGNAVIGEWCNLGADTNCSNLKNNYDEIKVWDEAEMRSVRTGLTFCGLLMGDHSKCGINTMFNTGTVVGVSANIYGGGFPEKFIPSFTWGGSDGLVTYKFEKAVETANRMMARRKKALTEAEIEALRAVFDATAEQRRIFAKEG